MEIWKFNDPEPLRPFLKVLQNHAPHLVEYGRRFLSKNAGASRLDLVCLAQGLLDSSDTVRQAVRVLIFSPPVADELGHFRRVLNWLPAWLPPGWYKHSSLTRLVAELACCLDNPQSCPPIATTLQVALKKRLDPRRQDAAHLSVPGQPRSRRYLLSILTRRLPYSMTPGLKRRLIGSTDLSLGHIYEMFAAWNRLTPMGAFRYWRKMEQLACAARPPVLNSSTRVTKNRSLKLDTDLRILSWGQRRSEEIAYLERLIGYQSSELVEVYNLAKEVSRRTKRVVLLLHNASLGAATGWGIPSFVQQVSDAASAAFVERVNDLRHGFAVKLSQPCQSNLVCHSDSLQARLDSLLLLWGKRLVRPRLLQDLWALRVSLFLNDSPTEEWHQFCGQAEELLDAEDHRYITQGECLTIAFEPPEVARQRLGQTLFWYLARKRRHPSLMRLLWGLIVAGEEWLQVEKFPHLVLPIIDKFFISSLRDQDTEYLPLFVELASFNGRAPLFLLVDDTSRAENASLKLAMERWRRQHPFLGLGAFGSDNGDYKAPHLESILANSSQCSLFALRPMTQVHNPVSFDTLLAQRPSNFLTSEQYDSSWKDNLPFLYHGTQVAPLTGSVNLTSQFPPALITSAGPLAFGIYYRHRLRQLTLKRLGVSRAEKRPNRRPCPLESLWHEYSELANLL